MLAPTTVKKKELKEIPIICAICVLRRFFDYIVAHGSKLKWEL